MTLPFYRAFEDRHRGSRDLIKSRLNVYLPFIAPLKSIYANCAALDVGCGRGEWLEVLISNGFDPIGVDLDDGMLAICKELKLPAEHGDAIVALQALPNESLTLVSGFHIAEHIPFESLQLLVNETLRVLKPAGLLILETPNAENISVGTHTFYMDPTHEKPIPYQLLAFLTEYTGFTRNKILRLQEPPELRQARELSLMQVFDGASPDYAVVAQKKAEPWQMVLFDQAFDKEYGLPLYILADRYEGKLQDSFSQLNEKIHNNQALQAYQQQELEQQRLQQKQALQVLERQHQQAWQELQTQLDHVSEQAHHWYVQSEARGEHIESMINSKSWRVTQPLRTTTDGLRWSIAKLKTSTKPLAKKTIGLVLEKPVWRQRINQGLQRYPRLHSRLNRFARNQGLIAGGNFAYAGKAEKTYLAPHLRTLTSQALDIYNDLEQNRQRFIANNHVATDNTEWRSQVEQLIAEYKTNYQQPAAIVEVDVSSLKEAKVKPKLAFVSPLPPERTGIADYSSTLLPMLAEYYDIEVVVAQDQVLDPWLNAHQGQVRDEKWLREHAHQIDRVLYQIGNAPFHAHMLQLVQDIPGTVVLHDFYLSGLVAWIELVAGVNGVWLQELYKSHGYMAVQARFSDIEQAKFDYPVNFEVLRSAQGLIVHADYSEQLAQQWYGKQMTTPLSLIPLLRTAAVPEDKTQVKQELGFKADDFIICSFGFINSTKLGHRLLNAFLNSTLIKDPKCHLVFVGEMHGGDYGVDLLQRINKSGIKHRIHITGFAEAELFHQYLSAADIGVQLREQSRGETSAAVLDCMNYALPLIVNANGSMAELDQEAVYLLPDVFEDQALIKAIESLWQSSDKRMALGQRAQAIIHRHHDPENCAKQYAAVIESSYQRALPVSIPVLIEQIAPLLPSALPEKELALLAQKIATALPLVQPAQRLFLDVTGTYNHDLKTGIERVARALVLGLLETPPAGFRVEPVYLVEEEGEWLYRYARQYTLELLGCPPQAPVLNDDVVDFQSGDLVLGLDLSGQKLIQAQKSGFFKQLQQHGVVVHFMVHDILPIRMPEVFPPAAEQAHIEWAKSIATFDGIVGVSKTVADDFAAWVEENSLLASKDGNKPLAINWSHHGADVTSSAPSIGLPNDAAQVLQQLKARPSFLMVGTIEPRKGYLQTIDAFTRLWEQGHDINLVIVGHEGWKGLADANRRDIPQTLQKLKKHPELKHRLFWLEGISDEYLDKVYAASSCLIMASIGEGFGLPLIEAAQHKLPIITRDIPVFKEVAGQYAFYFTGYDAVDLAQGIESWLELFKADSHPKSESMPWLTWAESARHLADRVVELTEATANNK